MHDFKLLKLEDDQLPSCEELPGDLPEVAEIVGVRLTLELASRFRGTTVHFHNTDALFRKHRNNAIRKEYEDGATAPKLARKFRLSERRIWDILGTTN
jgi:Mor family transcriptional regulator